jgi:hypothetical protein
MSQSSVFILVGALVFGFPRQFAALARAPKKDFPR